jgi:hypothetical protein
MIAIVLLVTFDFRLHPAFEAMQWAVNQTTQF